MNIKYLRNQSFVAIICFAFATLARAMDVPPPVKDTYSNWDPETTQKFITNIEPFRLAIIEMLKQEIDLGKDILEIGSGPLGGILHYVGDLTNVTPSEPNEESYLQLKKLYPRAINASANSIRNFVTAQYDIVVLSNVMDCIMVNGLNETTSTLSALKTVLKPGGKIVILQYYNPALNFIRAQIADFNKAGYLALPFEKESTVAHFNFSEPGFTLFKADKVATPFFVNGQSYSLKGLIDCCYIGTYKSAFYQDNSDMFVTTIDEFATFRRFAKQIKTMRSVSSDVWRRECGVSQHTFMAIFNNFLEKAARAARMKANKQLHKRATAAATIADGLEESMFAAYSVFRAIPLTNHSNPNVDLIYTVIALTDEGAAAR